MKTISGKPPTRKDANVERNIITLGWVVFFGGLAQEMIQPVLPLFYSTVLGLNKEFIGMIEGLLTTVVSLGKIGAGYISDTLACAKLSSLSATRSPLLVDSGWGSSAHVPPLLGSDLATAWERVSRTLCAMPLLRVP